MHTSPDPLRPAEVERLRGLVRKARPVLLRGGWSEGDVACIAPAIRKAIDAGDAGLVRCWAMWLGRKVMEPSEGVAVVPMLGFEAERRIADRKWMESRQK